MAKSETLVIFDMDGVLLDLELETEIVRAKIVAAFAAEGIECSFRPLLRSLTEQCDALAAADPPRAKALRETAWSIIDDAETRAARRCRPVRGARSLVDSLAGMAMAVFTNNHAAAADVALRRAGFDPHRFAALEARRGAETLKPSAAPIIRIIDAHPQAKRVFVIGDHPADMESAQLARVALDRRGSCCELIAIALRRSRPDPQMERAGADFIAADLAEVGLLVRTPRSDATLSVVLLAYNEEALIGAAVRDARRFGELYLRQCEVVVVDDGSSDGTAEIVRRLANDGAGDVVSVRHEKNQGMGAAMRDGYLAASKEYIAHLPGDRQVRPQVFAAYLSKIAPGRVVLSHYVTPPSGDKRKWVSLIFRGLLRGIGGLRINFAGTYVFHRRWLEVIDLRNLVSETFVFSFELLQKIFEAGGEFAEVEINNFPREVGESREFFVGRVVNVMREIARYRIKSWVQ